MTPNAIRSLLKDLRIWIPGSAFAAPE